MECVNKLDKRQGAIDMTTKRITLPVSTALELAGMSNYKYLPPVIRLDEKVLVLSEKHDCYFTTTAGECSCIQFISGVRPCPHQIRAFGHGNSEKVAQKVGAAVKERLETGPEECLEKDQEESKEAHWNRELKEHLKAESEFEWSRHETRERLKIEYEKQKDKLAQEARLQREHLDRIKEQQVKDRLQILNQIMQLKIKRKIKDEAMQEVPVIIEEKEPIIKKPQEDKITAHFRDD